MQNYQPRMQKPLKWQHLAPCTLKFLMESASSLNISHIRVQTHFIYWKALSKWQMLEFEDFRTAASGIWKWVCWDKSKRRLRTVKSGWKSIVASSVCSTLCNTIVLQSITHSFSASHHLILIKLESGRCPRSPWDRGWTVRNTGRVTSPSQTIHVYIQW